MCYRSYQSSFSSTSRRCIQAKFATIPITDAPAILPYSISTQNTVATGPITLILPPGATGTPALCATCDVTPAPDPGDTGTLCATGPVTPAQAPGAKGTSAPCATGPVTPALAPGAMGLQLHLLQVL